MTLKSIKIDNVLPYPLRSLDTSLSQVWNRAVTVSRGEFCSVAAASGRGKSSLCSFIYGIRDDYDGCICFVDERDEDTDIRRLDAESLCRMRRANLAFLPQQLRLFASLTALENVKVKNDLTHALSDKEIAGMFAAFGLEDKTSTPCSLLSVGEQQRVAIIRTLCQPFDFLLLDEPVSHLDTDNNHIAAEMILGRARSLGAGIISTSVGNPLLIPYSLTLSL